jgi:hypothetical protein
LKVEENIDKRIQQKFWGKGTRGRGRASVVKDNEKEDEVTNSKHTRGGGSVGRGRGFGHCKYVITCYNCGVEGHKADQNVQRGKT